MTTPLPEPDHETVMLLVGSLSVVFYSAGLYLLLISSRKFYIIFPAAVSS